MNERPFSLMNGRKMPRRSFLSKKRSRSYHSLVSLDEEPEPINRPLFDAKLKPLKNADTKSGKTPSPKPEKKLERLSSMGKLTQEIEDEFLTCKICLDTYKSPKSLNCLHTFCEGCIDSHVMSECTYKKYSDYREFTCPLCRKRTQLPIGGVKKLPDNFLVINLTETIGRQKPTKYAYCDICKLVNKKHKEATSKCLDCNKLLCKNCVETHRETKVTKNHDIFDVEIEKDIGCKEHPDEVVRFYCEPCDACVCVICTFNEHKDHEVTQFADAVSHYKDHIQDLVNECRVKVDQFDQQMEVLDKCENIIKTAEQKIHDTAIQYIADVRAREKILCEELQNIYGQETMEYINNKSDLSVMMDSLRSTCNLTEVILKGKDIELLLLKKDVEEKLSGLHNVAIKTLPNTINKEVKFIPGNMDFGYIQDMERPLLSKMRAKRAISGSLELEGNDFPPHEDKDVQTDKTPQTDTSTGTGHVAHTCESSIQTEEETEESSESSEEDAVEKCDQATETDEVETEEKAVNTRSRTLSNAPSREGEADAVAEENGYRERRRRRHRERAHTTENDNYDPEYSNHNSPVQQPPAEELSYWERRRQRRRGHHASLDADEYHDARA